MSRTARLRKAFVAVWKSLFEEEVTWGRLMEQIEIWLRIDGDVFWRVEDTQEWCSGENDEATKGHMAREVRLFGGIFANRAGPVRFLGGPLCFLHASLRGISWKEGEIWTGEGLVGCGRCHTWFEGPTHNCPNVVQKVSDDSWQVGVER